MMKRVVSVLFGILGTFWGVNALAETPVCDGLMDSAKKAFDEVVSTSHAYGCCTDTIQNCLNEKPECKSARYLFEDACNAAKTGKKDGIAKAVDERRKAMDPAIEPVPIVMIPRYVWGNPESKTVLTVYLCGRCPYCSRHVPKLVAELENQQLKDKIALNLRYFPIKSHDKSTPAAMAIEAAAQMGNAWPYLIKSYEKFDDFSLNQISIWAGELGLDVDKHAEWMINKEARTFVSESKKEGLKNGVTTTPTFFINGRRIYHEYDTEYFISLLRESLENQ